MTWAAPAGAAPPVFAPPQDVAVGGAVPQLMMTPNGDAILAWQGNDDAGGGVFLARRAAAGGPWSAPVRISYSRLCGSPVRMATNARGDFAIAWFDCNDKMENTHTLVTVAPAGGAFGPVEAVPFLPRAPASPDALYPDRFETPGELAMGADGTVAVAYLDEDSRALLSRVVVSQRPPGGRFGAPQVLAASATPWDPHVERPKLAADGAGRFYAVWRYMPGDLAGGTQVYAAEAAAGRPFGPTRLISGPSVHVQSEVQLVASDRGDVFATWMGGPFFNGFGQRSGSVDVAQQLPDGSWSAPRSLSGAGGAASDPIAAINDRGDTVVAWPMATGMATSFRAAGGTFGPPAWSPLVNNQHEAVPIAIDALGNSVALRIDTRVNALTRSRGASPEPAAAISQPGEMYEPAIAMDPFGNGVAAWTTMRDGKSYVTAAAYSAQAPAISGLRVRKTTFRLMASEAASMRITVRRTHSRRSASQAAIVRPGANAVTFGKRLRALLRKRGRYVATIVSGDAGPRRGRYSIAFKRR
jgi:hypothetical protein